MSRSTALRTRSRRRPIAFLPANETLIGQDGVHGFSEMPTAGMISWKGRDSGSLSIQALNDAVDVVRRQHQWHRFEVVN
jgi:hypothetical protein